ncbi:glycosyltransferase family 2 protein [Noviherbaspirillum suwonense]|uniref:N-terminal domain of galactosyltransferase n=1 Tax=Noviherbaspirillum suwonense TaxID=1224511 RepID=A0ABY1PVU2_9BURK|nr:glycosyltransferase family 2 protein [Noviherbaspirillum suwonense]RZA00947.1 MAG: glycosyltransferase family 2 protein [Moraxellaceae bacterium]SMP50490.1 N-terminal domain of galactosyltransferase [Noviherbaspirillum suwonense]
MKPDVAMTLVIPSYNRAQLILETINSALNQTLTFSEIIVVDDASTDSTLSELAQFGSRIKVIASEKIGVQAARNKGVAAASTPYVALCDSDDLLESNFVEIISGWLAEHQECDSIYSNFVTFDETFTSQDKFSGAPLSFFKGASRTDEFCSDIPDLYVKTVQYQPLFSSGVTIRKSFYQSIGGYDPKMNGIGSEDWEYTLRAIETGKVSVCMTPLVRIRRHSGNDSGNKIRQLVGEVAVLKHALSFHKFAEKYRTEIILEINIRMVQAFELAFSTKQYEYANAILNGISEYPLGIKFKTKVVFIKLINIIHAKTPSRELP